MSCGSNTIRNEPHWIGAMRMLGTKLARNARKRRFLAKGSRVPIGTTGISCQSGTWIGNNLTWNHFALSVMRIRMVFPNVRNSGSFWATSEDVLQRHCHLANHFLVVLLNLLQLDHTFSSTGSTGMMQVSAHVILKLNSMFPWRRVAVLRCTIDFIFVRTCIQKQSTLLNSTHAKDQSNVAMLSSQHQSESGNHANATAGLQMPTWSNCWVNLVQVRLLCMPERGSYRSWPLASYLHPLTSCLLSLCFNAQWYALFTNLNFPMNSWTKHSRVPTCKGRVVHQIYPYHENCSHYNACQILSKVQEKQPEATWSNLKWLTDVKVWLRIVSIINKYQIYCKSFSQGKWSAFTGYNRMHFHEFTGDYRSFLEIKGHYRIFCPPTQIYRILQDYRVSGTPALSLLVF